MENKTLTKLKKQQSELVSEDDDLISIRALNQRWLHRRRMAYISLFAILCVTLLAFFVVPIERLKLLDNVIIWFYTIMGGIVASYIGLATFGEKWGINNKNKK